MKYLSVLLAYEKYLPVLTPSEVDLLLASGRTLVPIEIKAAYTPGDDLCRGVRRFAALTAEAAHPTVIYSGRDIPARDAPSFLNFEHTATLIHGCP